MVILICRKYQLIELPMCGIIGSAY